MKIYYRPIKKIKMDVVVFCEPKEAEKVLELKEREVIFAETSMRNFFRAQEFLRRKHGA